MSGAVWTSTLSAPSASSGPIITCMDCPASCFEHYEGDYSWACPDTCPYYSEADMFTCTHTSWLSGPLLSWLHTASIVLFVGGLLAAVVLYLVNFPLGRHHRRQRRRPLAAPTTTMPARHPSRAPPRPSPLHIAQAHAPPLKSVAPPSASAASTASFLRPGDGREARRRSGAGISPPGPESSSSACSSEAGTRNSARAWTGRTRAASTGRSPAPAAGEMQWWRHRSSTAPWSPADTTSPSHHPGGEWTDVELERWDPGAVDDDDDAATRLLGAHAREPAHGTTEAEGGDEVDADREGDGDGDEGEGWWVVLRKVDRGIEGVAERVAGMLHRGSEAQEDGLWISSVAD